MSHDSDIHRFKLVDAKGADHDYALTLHAGTEGTTVALRIMALLSGPAAQGLVGLLGSDGLLERLADKGLDAVDVSELGEALGNITGGELAKALATGLGSPDTAKLLTTDLMRYVHRDGEPMRARGKFDAAYQGNYGELFKACMEVVKVNGFLPLSRT